MLKKSFFSKLWLRIWIFYRFHSSNLIELCIWGVVSRCFFCNGYNNCNVKESFGRVFLFLICMTYERVLLYFTLQKDLAAVVFCWWTAYFGLSLRQLALPQNVFTTNSARAGFESLRHRAYYATLSILWKSVLYIIARVAPCAIASKT